MESKFYQLDEYLGLPKEPQPWVIQGLVPVGGLVNVYAKPKVGKSWLVLGWAMDVASGKSDWEGYAIPKPGPVFYLQIDTPREEWSRRAQHVRETVKKENVPLYMADMWCIPRFPANILEPEDPTVAWLKSEVERIQPVMIIIDTLRETHGGDEDNSTIMRNVISALVGACRPAAIVLISHSRKDQAGWQQGQGGDDDMMDQNRGSSYVSGRMDVIVKMSPKRMQFKGRATGLVTETLVQDPETGWISLAVNDDGSDKLINELSDRNPGISINKLAAMLSEKQGYSVSTATRRIHVWIDRLNNKKEK